MKLFIRRQASIRHWRELWRVQQGTPDILPWHGRRAFENANPQSGAGLLVILQQEPGREMDNSQASSQFCMGMQTSSPRARQESKSQTGGDHHLASCY